MDLRFKSFAILAAVLVAAMALSMQEGVLLRLKLQPNTVDHYVMTSDVQQKITSPIAGDQDISIVTTGDYFYRFGGVGADGKADVTIEAKNLKVEASGPMPQNNIEEFTAKGKIDDRYRLSDLEPPADTEPQVRQMIQSLDQMSASFGLPEHPVKVGDTWEMKMPKNPMMGNMEMTFTLKYGGVREIDGARYHVILIDDEVPVDADISDAAEGVGASMGEVRMKGTMKFLGETLLEEQTGKLFSSEGTVDSDVTVTIPAMGADMKVVGTVNTTMKRAE